MKPFRIVGGLDVSPAQSEDNALAEARKRARPILRAWLRRVELYVMAGQLRSVDYMVAKEMCNYPSNATGASTCAVFGPALGCAIEYGRKSHPRSNLKGLSGPDLSPNTQSLDPIFGVPNANGFALRAM
jgi:hypothetical protein